MSNPWFRLYSEFASDHKMQMMSEAYQRRYVMLLCLRCSNGDVTLQDEEVAFQLRISSDEWSQTKAVFVAKNLIDKHNRVLAWERRQFISDSSVERVRKHREKVKQERNVTVTPPDTEQNRTDAEEEVKTNMPVAAKAAPASVTKKVAAVSDEYFDRFWEAYDYKLSRHKALKAWQAIKPDAELAEKIIAAALVYNKANPGRAYYKHATTWLNGRNWEDNPDDLLPKIARMQPKTEHQMRQDAVARSIFGHLYSNQSTTVIEGDVIDANENATQRLG